MLTDGRESWTNQTGLLQGCMAGGRPASGRDDLEHKTGVSQKGRGRLRVFYNYVSMSM
jgi:hypothetical protein